MKSTKILCFALFISSTSVFAQTTTIGATTANRCSTDSLSPVEAKGRNRLVKTCFPQVVLDQAALLAGRTFDDLEPAWEIVQKTLEMNGRTELARPSYYTPVFIDNPSVDKPLNWVAPKLGPLADDLLSSETVAAFCQKPENLPPVDPNYGQIGFAFKYRCKSSCFAPEVRVFFSDKYLTMKDAFEKRPEKIAVAKESSSFENMNFELKDVKEWTSSIRSEKYALRQFVLASGASFRVTLNHPLVTDDGYFREAKDVHTGDYLVRADGKSELIAAVNDQEYFGKVYNVQPVGESAKGNVIVAEGYLSGTAFVQNEGYEFINERVFRADLPEDLIR